MNKKLARMYAAREAWITRWTGYFGEPPKLDDYRQGLIGFRELYKHACKRVEDMATEAANCSQEAFE